MNRKTILNVLIAILLCASTFASVASAASEDEMAEDMHTVDITVDHEGEDENNMTVTVLFEWDYPSQMRTMASDGDNEVTAGEALEYETLLAASTLEDIQTAHRSHAWDMSVDGAQQAASGDTTIPWTITTSVTGLEGMQDDNDTFTVSVQLSMDMKANDMTTQNLTMSFGPLGDKDGGEVILPLWPTLVTVNDGTSWCAADISKEDGTELTSPFSYRADEEYDFSAEYSQDCENEDDRLDDDKDGVSNTIDQCPATPEGATVDSTGCEADVGCVDGTDDDGDGIDNCADTCAGTTAGESVNDDGCSQNQIDSLNPDDDDGTFNVTFNINSAEYTCVGMTDTSSAQDCMDAQNAVLSAVADVPAGHPHEWSWELQVNGVAEADQNASNFMLVDATSTFSWVAKCTSGSADCSDKTVVTVTELSGALEVASGDCVFFDGVTPVFGDAWDDLGLASRCFSAEGTYTSGDFTITVGSTVDTNSTGVTEPIVDDTTVSAEESTPGFGLVAGISAVLGAALIAASRRED